MRAYFFALALSMAFVGSSFAVGREKPKEPATFIKVEIKGKLQSGLVAIGGETTGTIIKADTGALELDFGGDKKLEEMAKKLDGKTALATGTLTIKPGLAVKMRMILRVKTIKESK
jgi:hypothetical protein